MGGVERIGVILTQYNHIIRLLAFKRSLQETHHVAPDKPHTFFIIAVELSVPSGGCQRRFTRVNRYDTLVSV